MNRHDIIQKIGSKYHRGNMEMMYSDQGYIPDWECMEYYIKKLPYADKI